MTTKLSKAQFAVLSAACQRADRNLLPLPTNLQGGAAQKVVGSLLAKGLIEEVDASHSDQTWRDGEDRGRTTLRATDAAFQALGIELEPVPSAAGDQSGQAIASVALAAKPRRGRGTASQPVGIPPAEEKRTRGAASQQKQTPIVDGETKAVRQPRANTKQSRLIALLKQPEGASLDEIMTATGWQAHTVRGAIAGALKKKLRLTVTSEKIEARGRVYRV